MQTWQKWQILDFPVPPGFTITTEACDAYNKKDKTYPAGLQSEIGNNLSRLERAMGAKLGNAKNPLLVSVRSGAAASMPGMMDTVLNLGLNPDSVQGLIVRTGNERFPWDAYRRFINMFGNVVMGMEHQDFEGIMDRHKKKARVENDTDLSAEQLRNICEDFIAIYKKRTGSNFPLDPKEQLRKSIVAVFDSWNNPRAIKYREIYDIKGLLGTAINVQAMVYGNMGNDSATGVCFTRNPSTGENKFYGEFLLNAQGEDVVAGIRTPEPISDLKKELPVAYKELIKIRRDLGETLQRSTGYGIYNTRGKVVYAPDEEWKTNHARCRKDSCRYGKGKADRQKDCRQQDRSESIRSTATPNL